MEIEKRSFEFLIEAREDEEPIIEGHAAVFNEYTQIMWWEERVLPGAFSDSIGTDDVRFLFNHDPNNILARTKNKTLELLEDEKGLFVRSLPADTTLGRDIRKLIKRGDITQMSFAFQIPKGGDEWIEGKDGQPDRRNIKKVRLFDVSAVTYPAYPTTDISARSYEEWRKDIEIQVVSPPIWRTNLLKKRLNLMKRRYINE